MSPLDYAKAHQGRFIRELQEFVRIPSISSDPASKRDVARCADWLAHHVRKLGIPNARVAATDGNPVVVGRLRISDSKPTLLVYGHYDVQPVNPLSEWKYSPFSAKVADGYVYGRGAVDDKGQLFAHLKAIESLIQSGRALPCNLVLLFEGEEEIGSPSLRPFLAKHRKSFESDGAVVSDTQMRGPGQPALTIGLRGKLSAEIIVRGPARDLHSGSFGGAVLNPIQALCEILTVLHDGRGRIAIPGFYDDVREASTSRRDRLRLEAPTEREITAAAQTPAKWGETGFSAYERISIRPSLSISGISGGNQGPGDKSIIPSHASAKISFRLVPNQDPNRIAELLREHLHRICPHGVKLELKVGHGARAVIIDERTPVIRAARMACRDTFGKDPVLLPSGGSIPIVQTFQSLLSVPTALMGFALPTDRLHGPNERFGLDRFNQAIEACIRLMCQFGRLESGG